VRQTAGVPALRVRLTSSTTDVSVAVAALRRGGLVGLPTETVYGLAADAENAVAVARVYAVKGRPADHPLIVHVAGVDALDGWVGDVPDYALRLAGALWPGPLTLVVPRGPRAGDHVTGGQPTVGLRAPDHPVAQALLASFGGGVAAPSANRFGRVSPTDAAHVLEELGDALAEGLDVVLDGGPSRVGLESTILDCTGPQPVVLRPGAIGPAEVERAAAVGDDGDDGPQTQRVRLAQGAVELPRVVVVPVGGAEPDHAARRREGGRREQSGGGGVARCGGRPEQHAGLPLVGREEHPRRGRVVRGERAWRADLAAPGRDGDARCAFDVHRADRARPQHDGPRSGAVQDGGLQADPARSAVEHDVEAVDEDVAQLLQHVRGVGRAHPAEAVGGRRRKPAVERGEQRLRDGVVRGAQPYRLLTPGHVVPGAGPPRHDERQRARPELPGEPAGISGDLAGPALERLEAGDVHDERVVRRPPLRGVDAGDGRGVLGVRREAVDRLRRHAHEPAATEGGDGGRDVRRRPAELGRTGGGHAKSLAYPPRAGPAGLLFERQRPNLPPMFLAASPRPP